ncbi:MAG TPA: BlaI/MecI/CopY family transcriptional regulator [Verrucomicrobiota bacterium]|nr:BlaI/MecI/CopY family transcriptional regulator [Verrucomicrobiota bacterium]
MALHPGANETIRMSAIEIPPAERDVLACIHQRGETTAREIREAMWKYRPMAHGSVVTLLKRLEAKGLVAKEKGPVGKAFVYHATKAPNTTLGRMVRDLVRRVFRGDPIPLVASLFETRPPTAEQVVQLQALVDELRRKQNAKESRRP